jgi:hypothetical protein
VEDVIATEKIDDAPNELVEEFGEEEGRIHEAVHSEGAPPMPTAESIACIDPLPSTRAAALGGMELARTLLVTSDVMEIQEEGIHCRSLSGGSSDSDSELLLRKGIIHWESGDDGEEEEEEEKGDGEEEGEGEKEGEGEEEGDSMHEINFNWEEGEDDSDPDEGSFDHMYTTRDRRSEKSINTQQQSQKRSSRRWAVGINSEVEEEEEEEEEEGEGEGGHLRRCDDSSYDGAEKRDRDNSSGDGNVKEEVYVEDSSDRHLTGWMESSSEDSETN